MNKSTPGADHVSQPFSPADPSGLAGTGSVRVGGALYKTETMIQWKHPKPEPPLPEAEIKFGDLCLRVVPNNTSTRWQSLLMTFGKFSDQTHEECLKSWPREALRLAKKALFDFEAALEAEE